MIEKDSYLKELMKSNDLKLISAEEICLKHNRNKWNDIICKAYNSKAMKERIKLEQKGVKQIKQGKYKFK